MLTQLLLFIITSLFWVPRESPLHCYATASSPLQSGLKQNKHHKQDTIFYEKNKKISTPQGAAIKKYNP